MRPHVWTSLTIAVGVLALAVPAHAGTVTTANACLYSFNNEYRNQLVTLGGSGSPLDAPAGTVATLSGASISAALPPSLPQTGYELGIFQPGVNAIPSQVWVAIAAANAEPATQVQELSVTASTTIAVDGAGAFVSGTPIVVTIPIPDTTWTVAGTGPVTFAQAPAGTLPNLPVGVGDQVVPVTGSIIVKPKLASLRFVLDCQPGSTVAPFTSFTPAAAQPFATLETEQPVAPVAPPPPPAAPAKATPRVASTKLKVAGRRVGVAIACPTGGPICRGRIALRSVAPVRSGGRKRVLAVSPGAGYSVAAGRQRTVRLTLSRAARRLMRTRRTLRVRVTLTPASGPAVKRDLTLQR
jgi:hypothetical protein